MKHIVHENEHGGLTVLSCAPYGDVTARYVCDSINRLHPERYVFPYPAGQLRGLACGKCGPAFLLGSRFRGNDEGEAA